MDYRVNFKQVFCLEPIAKSLFRIKMFIYSSKEAWLLVMFLILSGCSYKEAPRYRSEIESCDYKSQCAWAIFGNEDDGIYGEEANFLPNEPNDEAKARKWWIRNPLHNFCFYVIGSADKVNDEITLFKASKNGIDSFSYKPIGDTVFADTATSIFIALHGKKPFFSLRIGSQYRSFDFYLGWRERGNFGIKCCLRKG